VRACTLGSAGAPLIEKFFVRRLSANFSTFTCRGPARSTYFYTMYLYDNAFTSDIPWLAASAATVLLLGFLVLAAAFLVFRAVLPKRSLR